MSNGSEHIPERCVHAPVGPDLAGLRELPTPKPDYAALIGRLHAVSFGDDWPDVKRLLWDARNAVEALLAEAADAKIVADEWAKAAARQWSDAVERAEAERDALRARSKRLRENRMKERAALVARINDYRAERDALRAELDSMTVEWSAPDTGSILLAPFPFGYGTDEEMARRSAAVLHGPVYKRLVSPWTVVEGEQNNGND